MTISTSWWSKPETEVTLHVEHLSQKQKCYDFKSLTVLARGGSEHVAHSGLVPQASEFLPLRQLLNLLREEETSVGPHMQTHSQPPSWCFRNISWLKETFRFEDGDDYQYEIWLKVFARILEI